MLLSDLMNFFFMPAGHSVLALFFDNKFGTVGTFLDVDLFLGLKHISYFNLNVNLFQQVNLNFISLAECLQEVVGKVHFLFHVYVYTCIFCIDVIFQLHDLIHLIVDDFLSSFVVNLCFQRVLLQYGYRHLRRQRNEGFSRIS